MKGVILAGGNGTRLSPATNVTSKQLLPVYNKPLIYYPLSTLMLAGINDILVICKSEQLVFFEKLLGDGSKFGIALSYTVQDYPRGIAEALSFANLKFPGEKIALILGDNLFYGPGMGRHLNSFREVVGVKIFGYRVKYPQHYGVVELSSNGDVLTMHEKPEYAKSNIAITGLYFFDETYYSKYSDSSISPRGELEIITVLQKYLDSDSLHCEILPRGTVWFDTGTFEDMHDASTFIRIIEERTGMMIGSPQEIARLNGWL